MTNDEILAKAIVRKARAGDYEGAFLLAIVSLTSPSTTNTTPSSYTPDSDPEAGAS